MLMLSIGDRGERVTVKLFGRLAGPSAENFRFEIRPGTTLDVDLTGVTFIDSAGERSLSRLQDKGAILRGETSLARRLCRRIRKRRTRVN